MLKRAAQDKLSSWFKRSSLPLIMLGARQVGKTWLAKDLALREGALTHYINFEERPSLKLAFAADLDPPSIRSAISVQLKVAVGENDFLIFDEIQACPAALTSLKYFAERSQNKVLAAGSLLGMHLSDASFPVGLVEFMTVVPLTFAEFIRNSHPSNLFAAKYLPATQALLHQQLHDYFYVGGMPAAVQTWLTAPPETRIGAVRKRQDEILQTYSRDFAKHSGSENGLDLAELFVNIGSQLARYQDDSVSRFQFKGALPGKKEYKQFRSLFHWLERCGLIYRSLVIDGEPRFPLATQAKESFFKAFYFDIGLLCAQLKIGQGMLVPGAAFASKGFILENYVACELAARALTPLHSWKTEKSTAEIEFLLQNPDSGHIIPLEVKSQLRTKAKSLAAYLTAFNPQHALKLTLDAVPRSASSTNLVVHPLYDMDGALAHVRLTSSFEV